MQNKITTKSTPCPQRFRNKREISVE